MGEPTVGLDPKQIIEVRDLIKKLSKDKTVILPSHILTVIQVVCNRIIVLNNGSLIADSTPKKLLDNVCVNNTITVRIKGDSEYIQKLLYTLKNVTSVNTKHLKDGENEFSIQVKKDRDIQKKLFELLYTNNLYITFLSTSDVTLEDIFLKLTDNSCPQGANNIFLNSAESAGEQL